jgi:hypothetical protein
MIKYIALVALLCLSSKTFASFIYEDELSIGAQHSHLTKDLALYWLRTSEITPGSVQGSEIFHDKGFVEPTHSNLQIDGGHSFRVKGEIGKRGPLEVPEPSSLILLGIGILCVVKVRRSIHKIQ